MFGEVENNIYALVHFSNVILYQNLLPPLPGYQVLIAQPLLFTLSVNCHHLGAQVNEVLVSVDTVRFIVYSASYSPIKVRLLLSVYSEVPLCSFPCCLLVPASMAIGALVSPNLPAWANPSPELRAPINRWPSNSSLFLSGVSALVGSVSLPLGVSSQVPSSTCEAPSSSHFLKVQISKPSLHLSLSHTWCPSHHQNHVISLF